MCICVFHVFCAFSFASFTTMNFGRIINFTPNGTEIGDSAVVIVIF